MIKKLFRPYKRKVIYYKLKASVEVGPIQQNELKLRLKNDQIVKLWEQFNKIKLQLHKKYALMWC